MYLNTFKMINGDIAIGRDGDLVLVTGQEELRQNIENRLSINKNEWFLNVNLGLAYEEIRGKGVTDAEIGFAIRECTAQDDRIKSTEILEINRHENRYADIRIALTDKGGERIEAGGLQIG